jgi:hypothetical protein
LDEMAQAIADRGMRSLRQFPQFPSSCESSTSFLAKESCFDDNCNAAFESWRAQILGNCALEVATAAASKYHDFICGLSKLFSISIYLESSKNRLPCLHIFFLGSPLSLKQRHIFY